MQRRSVGLGKGLGALIPEIAGVQSMLEVPTESIVPNPRQPRGEIDQSALAELSASIREHGMLQPLVVQRESEAGAVRYVLIAGERRWRAARLAGLSVVPVVVKEVTAQGLLELALVENIQRQDLGALEEAGAYRQLVDEFGLTQEQVAERVGKARVTVANSLRLLQSARPVQEALAHDRVTEGHARALLSAGDEMLQESLLRQVVSNHLSVRQTEELVRRSRRGSDVREGVAMRSDVEEQIERVLGTRVVVRRSRKGGTVTIHFYSDEELEGLLSRLGVG